MAQNYIHPGDVFEYVVPNATTIVAGQPVLMGAKVGIALIGGTAGQTITVKVNGVFQVTKHGAASNQAWAVGDAIYWDAANSRFTKTATDNTLAGHAFAAALTTDTVGQVRLS